VFGCDHVDTGLTADCSFAPERVMAAMDGWMDGGELLVGRRWLHKHHAFGGQVTSAARAQLHEPATSQLTARRRPLIDRSQKPDIDSEVSTAPSPSPPFHLASRIHRIASATTPSFFDARRESLTAIDSVEIIPKPAPNVITRCLEGRNIYRQSGYIRVVSLPNPTCTIGGP
jgi:hypothetical protein